MPIDAYLCSLLEEASSELEHVTRRGMFGGEAFFAGGKIYAFVPRIGRIGLKLPEAAAYQEMLARPGAEPWCPGAQNMSHWVLIPEAFHDDPDLLELWVRRAHQLALLKPQKKLPARKKPAARSRSRTTRPRP